MGEKSTSIVKSIGDKIVHPKFLVCNKKQKNINLTFTLEDILLD